MSLYFITGNKNKLAEVKSVLPGVEQLDINLPEIQEIDAEKIIQAKLLAALEYREAEFIIEDTSLYFDCLKGLPGPLIKWFLTTIKNEGLSNIVDKLGDNKAEAKTIIGYTGNNQETHFFTGSIKGEIVFPRGDSNFGWDPIFQPEGHNKTFAEMSPREKNSISMRRIALNELRKFINKEKQ